MSKQIPTRQHYQSPLKGGWYYVDAGDEIVSGLMSKRQARKFVKKVYGGRYGFDVVRHPDCPNSRIKKIFTRP